MAARSQKGLGHMNTRNGSNDLNGPTKVHEMAHQYRNEFFGWLIEQHPDFQIAYIEDLQRKAKA